MAFPGLPQSGRTRVYRKIVAQLRTDAVLKALGVDWITWDGGQDRAVRPSAPARRLTIALFPMLGPMDWSSAEAQSGDMDISVQMWVPGTFDACDCLDLWTAIEQAIYPFNDLEKQRAFRKKLRGCDGGVCDAVTGEIKFTRPATIQQDVNEDGSFAQFYCVGSMSITVRRVINP